MLKMIRRLRYVVAKIGSEATQLREGDPERLAQLSQHSLQALNADSKVEGQLSAEFSRILSRIKINGVYKTTGQGRLRETERMLCVHLANRPHHFKFLDLGGSDGITTLDAVQTFRRELKIDVDACLLDLHPWLLRYKRGPVIEYRSHFEEPILVRLGKWGLRLNAESDNALANVYLTLDWFRRRLEPGKELCMINPLVQAEPSITVRAGDCLQHVPAFDGHFDIVRASNLLNLSYFSPLQISTVIGHLHSYLGDKGLLLISRNDQQGHTEIERGSLWEKSTEGFRHLEDFGGGSEVKWLVDQYSS